MAAIRILVANRPRLMRELVMATIVEVPNIEIVGEIQEGGAIETLVDHLQPDVLVVALEEADRLPLECYTMFQKHPKLRIIAIAPDRESSLYYWASLHIHSTRIEVSESGIRQALCGASGMAGGTL
jgi:chemotaxis response regulator CheB